MLVVLFRQDNFSISSPPSSLRTRRVLSAHKLSLDWFTVSETPHCVDRPHRRAQSEKLRAFTTRQSARRCSPAEGRLCGLDCVLCVVH